MVPPRPQSVNLEIDHVRNPGQRVPVRYVRRRERAYHVVERQAVNMLVVHNIGAVIKRDEVSAEHRAVRRYGEQRENRHAHAVASQVRPHVATRSQEKPPPQGQRMSDERQEDWQIAAQEGRETRRALESVCDLDKAAFSFFPSIPRPSSFILHLSSFPEPPALAPARPPPLCYGVRPPAISRTA